MKLSHHEPGRVCQELFTRVHEQQLVKAFIRAILGSRILVMVVIATVVLLAAGGFALLPAYTNPESRFYTSALGYAKVERMLGIHFKAEAQHPVWHEFATPLLGEGTMQCNFYYVPVLPMARVTSLQAEEGDKVQQGQLLAELDETTAQLNLNSARLAVATAGAQQQRIEIGSALTLAQERPEKDRIALDDAAALLKVVSEKVKMFHELEARGVASHLDLLVATTEWANAQAALDQARVNAQMSTSGIPHSKDIASYALDDAKTLLHQREEAMKGFRVLAPATGIVERVLIRPGEYNQDAGKPGFIIASGLWFEASLDQRAVALAHLGQEATVILEAYPGHIFPATVERIIPIVTFDAGGPETTRPIQSRGTGSPEWPATFKVRLHVDDANTSLAPGMSGFTRIICHHRGLAVPREAVATVSAGKGVVRKLDGSGHYIGTPVLLGDVDDQFVEITNNLDLADWVFAKNPRFLRDDDKVTVTRLEAKETSK
jgi:multidrug efflux pump subunit AcrA (membrane-fusion protein)